MLKSAFLSPELFPNNGCMKKLINLSLLSAFLILLNVLPATAQTAAMDIQKAEEYLKNLGTMKASFIQKAQNGARLSGTFYLNRPGKLRFEYNEVDDFIVADGVFIYFYDSEMREQTNAPIGQTLADFLLRDDLSLKGDITVQKISRNDDMVSMTLSETGDEGAGAVTLYFTENPYQLKKWEVIDATGAITEITLRDIQRDVDLPARLFAYLKPKQDKPKYN